MWRRVAVSIGLSLILLGLVAAVRTGVLADAHVMPGKAQGGPPTNAVAFQQGPDAQAAAPHVATQPECAVVTFRQGVDGYRGCADTRISAEKPNTNFGNQELILGMRGDVGTLIRFAGLEDEIPCGAIIVSATLGLYSHNNDRSDDAGPAICAAYPVTRTWEEMEATWIKATNLDKWGLPGCNDTTSDRSPTPLDHQELHERERWYIWKVTSAVQAWLKDPASNKGVYIRQVNEEPGEYDIRESEWPTPELRPYLAVEYCLPTPGITVTKELTDPPSGVAVVSDTVTFAMRITNGPTPITSLTVTDTYDSNYLTLISSSVEPDEQAPGIINWTDNLEPFLPLAPDDSFVLTLDFYAEKATDPDVTTNTVTAWGVDECGHRVGPETDDAVVKIISPPHYLYIPKVIRCQRLTESYCSEAGELIYRIESGADGFKPYTCTTASVCPLIPVPSPPAPEGWNQRDFDDSSWRPGSEVWWSDWDTPAEKPLWSTWVPDGSSVIGLLKSPEQPEGRSGTTHLYRRWFHLEAPAPGMNIIRADLEMWSDNKTNWWWDGELIASEDQNWIRPAKLFPGRVGSGGGRYLLAIQNSNDYVEPIELDTKNPQGTAFCLRVTWCNCPPQITRMLEPRQGR